MVGASNNGYIKNWWPAEPVEVSAGVSVHSRRSAQSIDSSEAPTAHLQ